MRIFIDFLKILKYNSYMYYRCSMHILKTSPIDVTTGGCLE